MNRHLELIGLCCFSFIVASCSNMTDPIYYDPNFPKSSENPEDNSFKDEVKEEVTAKSSKVDQPAVLIKPKLSLAEANAASAKAAASSSALVSNKSTSTKTKAPAPKANPNSSPFLQPDVYEIPDSSELKETSDPINSGSQSRRLSVPSNR